MIDVIILFTTVVFLLFVYFNKCSQKHPNFPPGPPKLPIWGSYWFLLKENFNFKHISLMSLAKRYKTDILGIYLGDFPTVVTLSHELCKEVLVSEEYLGRVDTIITRTRSVGELKGLFFADGPYYKEHRRFSLRHMRDYGFGRRSVSMENLVTDEVQYMMNLLRREPKENELDICRGKGQVLMPDFMYGSVLNMLMPVLSSRRYNNHELRECARAGQRFSRSTDATGCAITTAPWLKHIAPEYFGYNSVLKDHGVLLDFMRNVIDDHLQTFSDDHLRDFIDVYINETIKTNSELDYNQLLMVTVDYIFAAPIAISEAANIFFTYAINNPKIQEKVFEEINRIVGQSKLPSLDNRKDMPYTEACIRESLRIVPLLPLGIPRRSTKETTLAGYSIPSNTVILPCIWSAHRDEKVFSNPEEFQPERFLDENGNLLKKDHTIPFAAGKRLCPGETFSRQNLFLIISGIMQNFSMKSATGKPIDIELVPGLNISLKENWIVATPR